mgnify:CR=1 FL=1
MDPVSRRTNPRAILLAALQEGPQTREDLDWHIMGALVPQRRKMHVCDLTARHLCHLIRGGRVVRLGDGRYALRRQMVRIPAGTLKAGDELRFSIGFRTRAPSDDTIVLKIR